ncbi:MAG: hypothetical protein J5I65_10730 [Aridibacter famidurans]|nr:hypothetical protein [Aridibacter famidurans]
MTATRSALTLAILLACSICAFATAQIPDKLIYKGETHSLNSNPLEAYFKTHPDKRPKGGITSTALWRGYVATFEIKDGELILNDVEIEYSLDSENGSFDTAWKSVLDEVVPKGEVLKIDWFTGILVVPRGKIVNYVHMGYASTYENYTLLEIHEGKFTKAKEFDHKEYETFKARQFEAFKKTDEYKKLVEDIRRDDPDAKDDFIESFLRIYVVSYSTKILVD